MNESFINISPIARHEVSELIYSGNKIAAIKRYREAANCDLMAAKQAVEDLTDQLKNTNPALFGRRCTGRHDSRRLRPVSFLHSCRHRPSD